MKSLLKKSLCAVLTLLMVVSMLTCAFTAASADSGVDVWDGSTVATAFSSGSGTEADPYIIMSAAELLYMRSRVNTGAENAAFYKLGIDIVLNENVLAEDYSLNSGSFVNWWPMGTSSYKFMGGLDGDGHTISGFYHTYENSNNQGGFFGYVNGATIKNLKLVDFFSEGNNNDGTGGLVAVCTDSTITNVAIDGVVRNYKDGKTVGLLIANAGNVTVTDCVVSGLSDNRVYRTGSSGLAGGFIGQVGGGANVTFKNCVNKSDVYGANAGGFIGSTPYAKTNVNLSSKAIQFTDCTNYGNIFSTKYYNYNTGSSYGSEYGCAGGFIGHMDLWKSKHAVRFFRCTNEGDINGQTYAGGLMGKFRQRDGTTSNTSNCITWFTIHNCFNVGNISVSADPDEWMANNSSNASAVEDGLVLIANELVGLFKDSADNTSSSKWNITDAYYLNADGKAITFSGDNITLTAGQPAASDLAAYQSGSWLDDTTLWTVKAGQNPTLTLVAPADEHTHSYTAEVTAPTCTEQGYTTHTCACGDSYVDSYTDPTGHTYDEGVVTKAATCTETGVMTYTCNVCGATKTEDISVIDHDYDNGICKVCGAASETAPLQVSAASITLQSNIQANYKVNKNLFETAGYSAPYMTFTLNGKTTRVDEYVPEGNYYVFRFSDIAPDKMNDTITSVLYATKGETVEQIQNDYSIATYCYNLLEKSTDSDSALRTLLVDMLNYGAASQTYTGYNTANLVNAALSAEQKGWETSATPALTDSLNTAAKTVENATATWIGAALRLTDRVEMKFIIDTANIEGLTVKFTNAAGDVEYATVASDTFERRAAGGYYVYFDGFDASQMSEVVYVTAYNGDTAVSNTIAYSVETYAYAKQNSSVPNLGNLVIAMMKYGNAAKAYASV